MMTWNRARYRATAVGSSAALITIGALVGGCANNQNLAPPTTTTTLTTTNTTPPPTSTAPPAPTEKSLNPTGGNFFTPQVIAPSAPTEPPGVHRHRSG